MRISKTFSFDAAHRLPFHQGKCRNLHGHRYDVVITIEGNISEDINSPSQGMVKDFGELKVIKDWIDIHVDHAYIGGVEDEITKACQNDNLKVYIMQDPSTAECLARHFFDIFSTMLPISSIQVFETPTASVTYP